MLHYETISTEALELLINLQKIELFNNLRLVGGTSLALQLGHRKSIDLDLFGILDADEFDILYAIQEIGDTKLLHKSKNIIVYLINGIKTDFVRYSYQWLEETCYVDGLKLASKRDIAAMKLAAITGRGTKKDFIDIYFLLREFSLKEMIDLYNNKYSDGSSFLVLKSLGYFADAENDPMPVMLKAVSWELVKNEIKSTLADYLSF